MNIFFSVVTGLINTAVFIVCVYWAYWALQKLNIPLRYGLSFAVQLLIVLAVGNLAFGAVSRILNEFYSVLYKSVNGWIGAFNVFSGLAMLAFIGWLYWRNSQGK